MDNRRQFLKTAAGFMAASTSAAGEAVHGVRKHASTRPNVLWIMGDQHRAQALGCLGDPNLSTPNLDRLAGRGTTAIAGCPLCTPFRGSMLTSRYPHECCPGHDHAVPDGMPTVAHAFRNAGYQTAYFGKWHVDGCDNRAKKERSGKQFVRPERRGGFDTWLGYENNNAQWDCWLHGHGIDGKPVDLFKLPEYETDAITNLAIDFLRERGEERAQGQNTSFFAVLSVQPPHSPYKAPEEWMARHKPEDIVLRPNVPNVGRVTKEARRSLAGYYAMIENLDWNIGRVIETLATSSLLNDTYVIFLSDHGDMHGSHGRVLKCVPWEESVRIPFLVSRGGKPCQSAGDSPWHSLINHVDIAPTTLGLCGIETPSEMRGFDYAPHFGVGEPGASPPDSAFLQLVDPGYKYGFASDRERPWRGIVTDNGWKYAVFEGQPWLLYNLNEDPYELVNLAWDGRFRAKRQELQDRLAAWMNDTGDHFELPKLWT